MDYPYKSVTDTGIDAMSNTIGQNNNNLIIDKVILSDQPIQNTNDLHNLTTNDFHNPFITAISIVQRSGNILQPQVTIHNSEFKHNYSVYMIGLLAHTTRDSSEFVYSVAMSKTDPFVMPKASKDELDWTISIPVSFANSNNVEINAIDDDYSKLLKFEDQTNQKISMIIKNMNANQLKGMKLGEIKD